MISEIIEKWIKGILIDGITGNLSGLFDNVNAKVGEIASDVGSTPQAWNSGIFNMLRSLSETVVLPIAAAILALVMCHELIQMITEKNNMHDFDTSMFFRWIFKSAFAILIVSNTWNIVMGVFDATQSVVNQSSGVIIGETSIHFDRLIPGLEFQLESMTIGSLLSLWFQTLVVGLTMNILSICIFLVTYGRMIEIYVVTALGPIPLATMGSSEWRSTGQNYLKSLLALGFQAFLIMIVVGFLRRVGAQVSHPSHFPVRPGEKTGMVMVGQLVHGRYQRRIGEAAHVMLHGTAEAFRIAQQVVVAAIAVFFHAGQEPGHRLHEGVVVHHRVPLIALEPVAGVPVVLRQNDRLRVSRFHRLSEPFPEIMVDRFLPERKHTYGDTSDLEVSFGDKFFLGGVYFYNFTFFGFSVETGDSTGENPGVKSF